MIPALHAKLLRGGGTTRHWPTDAEVIEAAVDRPIFSHLRTPALRLILERLQLAHRSIKSEETNVQTLLQIEHVLPQQWGKYWPLKGQTIPSDVVLFPYQAKDELAVLQEAIRTRNHVLQTLGNLTLLNKHLNPAASNSAYETKRVEYVSSVLRLNRYFESADSWDEEAILQRGRLLGEALCKIWRRPELPAE